MAVTTRGITAPKAPAVKSFSRPKASSKTKAFSKSKSVSQTKTASKPAQNVPIISFPGTASLDLIEKTNIKALNSATFIRKLI